MFRGGLVLFVFLFFLTNLLGHFKGKTKWCRRLTPIRSKETRNWGIWNMNVANFQSFLLVGTIYFELFLLTMLTINLKIVTYLDFEIVLLHSALSFVLALHILVFNYLGHCLNEINVISLIITVIITFAR